MPGFLLLSDIGYGAQKRPAKVFSRRVPRTLMQGQSLLPERQPDRLWPFLRETFQLTQVRNHSEARG